MNDKICLTKKELNLVRKALRETEQMLFSAYGSCLYSVVQANDIFRTRPTDKILAKSKQASRPKKARTR